MASLALRNSLSRQLLCSRCSQLNSQWRRLCSNATYTTRALSQHTSDSSVSRQRKDHHCSQGAKQVRAYTSAAESSSEATPAPPRKASRLASLKGQGSKGAKVAGSQKKRRIFGQTSDKPIRARFAPSPTGFLHLGSLRTALFNNLATAASEGGSFILRLEDTDQNRLVPGAEERIYSDLKWLGLEWTEGPDCGGPYGPYKQSERLDIYKDHVQQLVDNGHAYRCFCKPEDLEEQKRRLHEAGKPTVYPGTCRSVGHDESQRRADAGESHIVRFKGDAFGNISLRDAIYGPFQKKDAEEDFVLLKTDGYPTYHLANVVDDHLMKITHVLRGEEWLISTPKHVALYKAFGWEAPTFAHLGLLINDDGTKLSKRNQSSNVSSYRDHGYSPIALQIWLAGLGSSFTVDFAKSSSNGSQFPRTLQNIADTLSFKFTRGGIKLNMGTLQHYESRYRQALVHHPIPSLTKQETAIIETQVLYPLLEEIQSLTQAQGDPKFTPTVGPAWDRQDKELVPTLSSPDTAIPYLRRIYAHSAINNRTMLDDMQQLVLSNPQYFWRVPTELYRRSLLVDGYDQAVLDAIESLCDQPELWEDPNPSFLGKELSRIATSLNPNLASETLYRVHRLVARGDPSLASHSASVMFNLMGREEWKHRITVVKDLVRELEEGGSDVRFLWAQEAKEKDPELASSILEAGRS